MANRHIFPRVGAGSTVPYKERGGGFPRASLLFLFCFVRKATPRTHTHFMDTKSSKTAQRKQITTAFETRHTLLLRICLGVQISINTSVLNLYSAVTSADSKTTSTVGLSIIRAIWCSTGMIRLMEYYSY